MSKNRKKQIRAACYKGDLDQVKRLIGTTDNEGDILWAVRSACDGDQGNVFQYLIDRGAVSEKYCREIFTKLYNRRRVNIIGIVCKYFRIDSFELCKALYVAIACNCIAMVRVLLDAGADFVFFVLPRIRLDSVEGRTIFKLLVRANNTRSRIINARAFQPLPIKCIEYIYRVKRSDVIELSNVELEYLANKHLVKPYINPNSRLVNIASVLVCKDVGHFLHRFIFKSIFQ